MLAVTSGPRYNSYAHSFAGMSIQFILFMGIDAGITLLLIAKRHVAPLARRAFVPCRVARQPRGGHRADRNHDSGGRLPGGARGV